MQKEERLKHIRTRKNFFITLIIIISLWTGVGLIIYFLDPRVVKNVFLFFLTTLLASFLTFATIFENSRRGMIVSFAFVLFLLLRYFQIGTILNLVLIIAITVSFELFFSRR